MKISPDQIIEMIVKLKVAGFETIEINADGSVKVAGQSHPAATIKPSYVPEAKAEELVNPMSALDDYSDEELLYYATPYFDELMAKKDLHNQQLKDEKGK